MVEQPDDSNPAACVLDAFLRQAAATPEAIAVEGAGKRLTYTQLRRSSSRLAGRLAELGVGPEVPVGVAMRRSPEQVASTLAVVLAGGAYLPLDPQHPRERLAYMLTESGARVVLTHRDLAPSFEGSVETLLYPEEILSDDSLPEIPSRPELRPESLLYLIFTSGSTGRPRGVAVPHGAVVALTRKTAICNPGPGSRMGQVSNASFDMSVWELWGTLLNGATLVVIEPEEVRAPDVLARRIQERRLSHLVLSASLFNEVVWSSPGVFSGARQIICGGEKVDPASLRKALAAGGPEQLVNGYGPTEATAMSACKVVSEVPRDSTSIPIGRALEGEELLIADARLTVISGDTEGEILIGGAGVARGYHGRPRETALAFVPHPCPETAGARVYRTGDLARWTPEGQVDFIGRKDHQVKLRGYRIEPGEIEARLGEHPAVDGAVVLIRGEGPRARLVAYLRPQGELPSHREIREFLSRDLPEYMLPTVFVPVDAWPLTLHGKLDRVALPEPAPQRPDLPSPRVAPITETESRLAEIWSRMLGISQVGIDDSLFELGGHSLLLTRMLSQVRELFGVEVPMDRFFEEPTVRGLGAFLDSRPHASEGDQVALGPVPGLAGSTAPLSFSQQRVWFLLQLQPGNLAYQAQCYFRFRGPFVPEALRRSLQDVVGHHEIFRTSFVSVEGRPVQVVHPPPEIVLPMVDLSGLPADRRQEEGLRVTERICRALIDPGRVSLVNWVLLRLAPSEHWLVHVEHHLVHDGWSFNVFLEDLAATYRRRSRGEVPRLPEVSLRFADYAVWQHRWVDSPACRRQIDYWVEKLEDRPEALALPLDRPRPSHQSFRGSVIRWKLPRELARAVRTLCRRRRTTVFVGLQSAFAVLLSRYGQQRDLLVGSGIANRRWLAVERLIGMLVNNVVLRNDLSGNPSFADVLHRTHRTAQEAYAHQDVPFDKVVEALRPDRGAHQNPLFQVFFSFHDAPLAGVDFGEPEVDWVLGLSNDSAKFDLNVIGVLPEEQRIGRESGKVDEEMTFLWEYNRDLFDSSTVRRMMGHFRRIVEEVTEAEERPLGEIRLLSPEERQQLVGEWAGGRYPYPAEASIPEIFTDQAARTPEAVAVVFGEKTLSYGQLEELSSRLAHRLVESGLRPEAPVGLFAERGAELVVALLGILKAGGAYLPLDPSYPADRLRFMVKDSGVELVLTTADLVPKLDLLGEVRSGIAEIDWDVAADNTPPPAVAADPEQLAYIMYTSGSTGRPKGVAIPHRAVLRLVRGTDFMDLGLGETFLHLAPISFDASTLEVWGPLLNGGRLVVAPPGAQNLEAIGDLIRDHRVTSLWLTAGLFHLMADSRPEDLAGLRQLLAGGDVLSPPRVEKVLALRGGPDLINGYGPTENTTFSACHPMASGSVLDPGSVPIGRPIANTQGYVVGPTLRLQPQGLPGELVVGGDGLARGYVGRPALTAERFVPCPFGGAGGRMYRTGDRVRLKGRGALDFLGRWDRQVKVRGFRIELGEIEAALNAHPGVRECAVLVLEEGDQLAAAVVLAEGSAAELRPYLARRLPEFMVPGVLQAVEALPLGPNGKVDRRALGRRLAHAAPEQRPQYLAPRTEIEELLVQIWSELVPADRIGVLDDFFELGGHSLHATRHMYRVQELLGIPLPVRTLYEAPTVEALARLVEDHLLRELEATPSDDAALPLV